MLDVKYKRHWFFIPKTKRRYYPALLLFIIRLITFTPRPPLLFHVWECKRFLPGLQSIDMFLQAP